MTDEALPFPEAPPHGYEPLGDEPAVAVDALTRLAEPTSMRSPCPNLS